MTAESSRRPHGKTEAHPPGDQTATLAGRRAPVDNSPATAATVRLATAAHALGISQAAAVELAERDEFPCTVIWASDGYHVLFAALLRILRSGGSQCPATPSGQPDPECPGR